LLLKRKHVKIKAVAIDMGKAYISAMNQYLPETPIVFDHFHVVKLINKKIDELRRQSVDEAQRLGIQAQKGQRWAILKNPENLTDKQRHLLDQLLQLNTPLAKAYLLKEQFRTFWDIQSKNEAKSFLDMWLGEIKSIGSHILNTLARTIKAYSFGLLSYFECPISSAAMEGINNKIRTMNRQAYGYRDIEFFKLKIKAIHETRYALFG
jgi:transposase